MENLGDFLPLIIIAITFIYSFISGTKKKKEEEKKQPVPRTDIPQSSPTRNAGRKPVVETTVPPVEKKYRPIEKKYESLEDLSDFDIEQRLAIYTSIFSSDEDMPEDAAEEYSEIDAGITGPVSTLKGSKSSFALTEPEEIKKAVIYSEIFNKKYF